MMKYSKCLVEFYSSRLALCGAANHGSHGTISVSAYVLDLVLTTFSYYSLPDLASGLVTEV
jgi:hypothetical protein